MATREISLANSHKKAIVDDEDYERIYSLGPWCIGGLGYAVRDKLPGVCGEGIKGSALHRDIIDCPEGKVVDHKNLDKLDNSRGNLWYCSNSLNVQRSGWKSKVTGLRGVQLKQSGKYTARISIDGKQRSVGTYDDRLDAARAYDDAARKQYGPNARLNFPTGPYKVCLK